ncbi:MAG: transcriptional regulator CecR [Burkholderiaceae bacterium]
MRAAGTSLRRPPRSKTATPAIGPAGDRRGDEARRSLLAAALDEFSHRGLEDATTREIARKSGQNIAAIAYHFGSKEGLYIAVADAIAARMRAMLGPELERMEALSRDPSSSSAACLEGVKTLLRGMCHAMTMEETRAFSRIIIREQIDPTAAFDTLYRNSIGRMHMTVTILAARVVGDDPQSTAAVIRAHALVGSVLGFRVARETILRRAGWKTIGPGETASICDAITEQADVLLRGLRAARRRTSSSSSRGQR